MPAVPLWRQHIWAGTVLVLGAVTLASLVAADRTDPVILESGYIAEDPVRPGQRVHVRWTTTWQRQCEGVLSRELVGSDGVVKAYRKHFLRVPVNLGRQTSDTRFIVPEDMAQGEAVYSGIIRFHECGVTSRFVPLKVEVPEIGFSVAK